MVPRAFKVPGVKMMTRKAISARVLSVALFLLVLAVNAPAALAQVTRFVEVDPAKGRIGDSVTVHGEGFNRSTDEVDRYAAIFFSSQEATTDEDIDKQVTAYKLVGEGVWLNELGAFETQIVIPEELDDGEDVEEVVAGTYYVYVCHYYVPNILTPRIRAVTQLTVTVGEIKLSTDAGPVNTLVEISGSNFSANTSFSVFYDGVEIDVEAGGATADSEGEFVSAVRVPESIAGPHTIAVRVPRGEVSAGFTVQPEMSLNVTAGEAGDTVIASGTGFGRTSDVSIFFDGQSIAAVTTSFNGSFFTDLTVPQLPAGVYVLTAQDEAGNRATFRFTVVVPPPPTTTPPVPAPPAISISPAAGAVGAEVTISGAGFAVGEAVTITYDGVEVAEAVADTGGRFTTGFRVPASRSGAHTITVSNGAVGVLTFTVESEAPPAPGLSFPQEGQTLAPPLSFDWEDADDESVPVTYDLQIATDGGFSAGAVVLEKRNLNSSRYTLTEAEASGLAGREASYYWRVRAIDGASNQGEWTAARQFRLAVPGLPEWAIYVIAAASGALLGLLGVWLWLRSRSGKVTAPDS